MVRSVVLGSEQRGCWLKGISSFQSSTGGEHSAVAQCLESLAEHSLLGLPRSVPLTLLRSWDARCPGGSTVLWSPLQRGFTLTALHSLFSGTAATTANRQADTTRDPVYAHEG